MNTLIRKSLLLAMLFANGVLFAQYSAEKQKEIDEYTKIVKSPLSSKIEKADALNSLGFIYRLHEDYQLAIESHEKSLDYFIKENHIWGQALSYSYLGYVYSAKKNYKTSLEYLEYSYKLFSSSNYLEDASFVLTQIGFVYCHKLDFRKAIEQLEKAYKLSEKANDKWGMSNALNGLGFVYQTEGNLPKALECYEQSLKLARELKDKDATGNALLNVAWVYFEQGNFYKVIECGQESLKLFTDMYNYFGVANSLNIIGAGYKELAEYPTALDYLLKCLKQNQTNNDAAGIAIAYNNIGTVYFMEKKLPEALKYHELGLKKNLELGDKYNIALSTNNVGEVYLHLDQIEDQPNGKLGAKSYALKAEKLAIAYGNPRLIRNSKQLLFEIYTKQGDLETAERYGLEMIDMNDKSIAINFPTLSENEKEHFFQNISAEYMQFNYFVLERKKANPALTAVVYDNTLKQKGLLLKSSTAMRHAIFTSNDTTLIAQFDEWISLKTEIAKAYTDGKNTTDLEEKANALEKLLVKNSQSFSDLDKIQNLTWKDVQKNLKEGEAAIEFLHFNDFDSFGTKLDAVSYCALIVTPTCAYPEMIKLCQEEDLKKLLGAFGGNNLNYINDIYGTNAQPNTKLYELIWKPMEEVLKNSKTIYLSPTGLLHRVAFSAISQEKSVLLCDSYNIQLQSSTGKIAMPEQFELESDWKITLFGGIDYDSENSKKRIWSFLEGTKLEVENISALLTKGNYDVTRSTTEEGFKENAPTSDIIHMSTHGFFYPDPTELAVSFEPEAEETGDLVFRGTSSTFGVKTFVFNKNPLMRSGLVLSGANGVWNSTEMGDKEDGVLTAYEVAQIDLRKTGLVVLSACETGLGDINGSEGVYGLQRAFKIAGVKFIVMSLWQVPDKETQEFMTLFYKNLLSIKDVKQAFLATQGNMRKKYDPYYWAAFVLVE